MERHALSTFTFCNPHNRVESLMMTLFSEIYSLHVEGSLNARTFRLGIKALLETGAIPEEERTETGIEEQSSNTDTETLQHNFQISSPYLENIIRELSATSANPLLKQYSIDDELLHTKKVSSQ